MSHLESDLLRTFLAVARTGSITEGAARIHRTQSAASLQIKRLERVIGRPVFERHGRGVALTPAGETLLPVARDITSRLDTTLRQLNADEIGGRLRLGIPDDHSHGRLARIISEFSQSHPLVDLEVVCDLSAGFPEALHSGDLDMAVYEVASPGPMETPLWQDQTHWVMAPGHDLLSRDPLPVALFDRECWWRDAALRSLEQAGRPHRVVFSSQSVAGVTAAVEAGIAIGLLGQATLPEHIVKLGAPEGFPDMPPSSLVLGTSAVPDTPARHSMAAAIRHAFDA